MAAAFGFLWTTSSTKSSPTVFIPSGPATIFPPIGSYTIETEKEWRQRRRLEQKMCEPEFGELEMAAMLHSILAKEEDDDKEVVTVPTY